ncbi:MAG: hypothetical protein NDI69_06475 [Bacteriovoracaceae bacterium]|nr:hypothetical protein [Bacteriovoracaceae bacterium]
MKTLIWIYLFTLGHVFAFEPGLSKVQEKCASLEKGSLQEVAFLEGVGMGLMPLSSKTCLLLKGHYSGAYYEKKGKLYGKAILDFRCDNTEKELTIEIFTKKKKRLVSFKPTGTMEAKKESSVFLKSSEALGRIDFSFKAPLRKMYFRTSGGEAFILNMTKDKKQMMPMPKVEDAK